MQKLEICAAGPIPHAIANQLAPVLATGKATIQYRGGIITLIHALPTNPSRTDIFQ